MYHTPGMVEDLNKARGGLIVRVEKSRDMEYQYKPSHKFTNVLQFHSSALSII